MARYSGLCSLNRAALIAGIVIMAFSLSKRSRNNLKGVHPDLVRVVERALDITSVDFVVIEGMRTKERQVKLVAAGASRTMNSRHLTGHAVDLAAFVDGQIRWDWPLYDKISYAMKEAADDLGVQISWGGDWKWRDGPHYELRWSEYPIGKPITKPKKPTFWARFFNWLDRKSLGE